ncbi:MAG TPA: polysaccharide pyruvyl transferase family protein [Candidatus Elarobacter sp.]|nr:polysaccharide pyruvyl transferase family protein [Candidatus Elarobacter sp.]
MTHGADRFLPVAPDSRSASPLVAELADRIERSLAELLERGRPVALINFPNHANPGDNAIWLGTQAALRGIGVPVGYAAGPSSFDAAAMRDAVGDGPLLLNGGGNFGDLYSGQQDLRERVLAECRDRRIVQLPQSIAFRDLRNAARMRRLCAAHPDFTLLVRERRSYELACRLFEPPPRLVPDMAFALRRLDVPTRVVHDTLWLLRDDAERVAREPSPRELTTDWTLHEPAARLSARARLAVALKGRLEDHAHAHASDAGRRRLALGWTLDQVAQAWVRRGAELVGSSRVLVTDRLHAHAFALLLGVPHVVLDNSYGKVRSTFETWTGRSELVRWADSTAEARDAAARLLARTYAGA